MPNTNTTVLQAIVSHCEARERCAASGNSEWYVRHGERAAQLVRDFLPSGSGFDSGTKLVNANGVAARFETSFHHMDDMGGYDGWTDHLITVRPDLASGFTFAISGKNRNGIKDYIVETFDIALRQCVRFDSDTDRYAATDSAA